VAADFNHVLAGHGVRSAQDRQHDFIHHLTLPQDPAVMQRMEPLRRPGSTRRRRHKTASAIASASGPKAGSKPAHPHRAGGYGRNGLFHHQGNPERQG